MFVLFLANQTGFCTFLLQQVFSLKVKQFDESRHGENFLHLTSDVFQNQSTTLGGTFLLQFQHAAKSQTAHIFQIFTVEHDAFVDVGFQKFDVFQELGGLIGVEPTRKAGNESPVLFFDIDNLPMEGILSEFNEMKIPIIFIDVSDFSMFSTSFSNLITSSFVIFCLVENSFVFLFFFDLDMKGNKVIITELQLSLLFSEVICSPSIIVDDFPKFIVISILSTFLSKNVI